MKNLSLFVILLISVSAMTGCNFMGGTTDSEITDISKPSEDGRLNLVFELPENEIPAAIRASSGNAATLTAILNVVQAGRVSTIRRTVSVISGTANVAFAGLPQGSTLGEFYISGGHLAGFSDFHGAVDLGAGENLMPVSPIGSGLDSDILATVIRQVIQTSTIIQTRSANLIALASGMITELRTQAQTVVQTSTIFEQMLQVIRPTGLVTIKSSADLASISGYDSTNSLIWRKDVSNALATVESYSSSASDFKFSHVIRQGLDGKALVAWQKDNGNSFVITVIDSLSGETIAAVTNPGNCFADSYANDSVVIGGYHSIKKCPVIYKWNLTSAATTGLTSGSVPEALEWCTFFEEFSLAGKAPEVLRLSFIAPNDLKSVIEDAANNRIRYININFNDGAYSLPDQATKFNVSVSPGNGLNRISWLQNSASNYSLCWGTSSDITEENANKIASVTSPFSHDNLTNGQEYFYFLVETKNDNSTAQSYKTSATPMLSLNQPPVIAILEPQDTRTFILGADIIVDIRASDPDGKVASVSLYVDNALHSNNDSAPFSYRLTGLEAGKHTLYAVVSDDTGARAVAERVEITILSEITGADFAGKITGQLKDENTGQPIEGALIGIAGTTIATATDANGYFEIPSLAPGFYDLVIKRDGYASRTIKGVRVD